MDYNLKFLKKIKWHYFNQRHRSPFFQSLIISGLTRKTVDLGLDYTFSWWLSVAGWNICPEQEFFRIRKELLVRLERNSGFIIELIGKYKRLYSRNLKLWQKIKGLEVRKIDNNRLEKLFNDFNNGHLNLMSFQLLPVIIEQDLEEKLKDLVSEEEFKKLIVPIYPSTLQREREERRKIRNKKQLSSHWLKYCWISDNLFFFDYLPLTYFGKKERVEGIKSTDFDLTYRQLKPTTKKLVDTIQWSIWFRNFRLEEVYHSTYLVLNLFQEIAQRLEIKLEDLTYFTPPEISAALLNKELAVDIKKRKKSFVIIGQRDDKQKVISGQLAKKFIQTINPGFRSVDKSIKGMSAYPGKIIGEVVLVKSVKELKKIGKNRILVTHGTTPQYTPYLKRVKGIITDEGGILCHAAIISRELNIPCVIGTKIATRVLKDGDIVEVDANKGIIKKI